jgi:S1-C subfamily serine protease
MPGTKARDKPTVTGGRVNRFAQPAGGDGIGGFPLQSRWIKCHSTIGGRSRDRGECRAAGERQRAVFFGVKERTIMRKLMTPSSGRVVLAHAMTALVTLVLALLVSGGPVGMSRPTLLAQAGGRERTPGGSATTPPDLNTQTPPPPEDILKDLDPDEQNNVRVYNADNKGVVNITTEAEVSSFFGDETSTGTGSGFVIDKDGHVLTNFHVIQGAHVVRVTLFDGSAYNAKLVGFDASNDVAVLQVRASAERLFPLRLGDSSKVMVGQKILALGNPFGLERTLTSGIVSSLDRSLKAKNGRMIKGIIQTDAAINPGNSGGPLLNSRGQVIGMNMAIMSNVGQSAGISFAVPINAIARILDQLIANGRVIRADLGISKVYGTGSGLLVLTMTEGGAAERAGIRGVRLRIEQLAPGIISKSLDYDSADMIVAIDHKRVKSAEELLTEVERHRPGETVRVTVIRDGHPKDIVVVLGQS